MIAREPTFTIGTLAEYSGCSIDTIRYYERLRLIPRVSRTEGGHRLYHQEHTQRLRFIRCSRDLGLSLAQVRGLLDAADRERLDCGTTCSVLEGQRVALRQRIAEFRALERDLNAMIETCRRGAEPSCRIGERSCHVIESRRVDDEASAKQSSARGSRARGTASVRARPRSALGRA